MATKETDVQRSAGRTIRYKRRGRMELPVSVTLMVAEVSDGQDAGTPLCLCLPGNERGNEPCQEYSQSLRRDDDDADVNLGTPYRYPWRVREPEPICGKGGGVPVVVRDRESRSHGEGGQSNTVHSSTQTKPEIGGIDRLMTAQKQRTLAVKASRDPAYGFHNLYDLLHWDKWIRGAANTVLSRPGSRTDGVDGKTRDYFRSTYEQQIAKLKAELKHGVYTPLPVRRVYIPKANGKKRPLGIPTLRDRIVQEALRMILDPIYESDFQPYSFGFRKGRRTMDAIAVIMPLFNTSAKHYY